MTVTINGTTGIAGTNGSAGTPAVQGEDTNTGIFFPAADTVAVATAGTERVRMDSSGNVGIGTTSPSQKLQVNGGFAVTGAYAVTANGGSVIATYGGSTGAIYSLDPTVAWKNLEIGSALTTFSIDGSERARIDTGGNLLLGTTSLPSPFTGSGGLIVKSGLGFLGGTASTLHFTIQSNTADFYIGNPNLSRHAALIGLNTFTAWSFGSDRRIKDNIEDLDYGLEAVLAMRPRQYTLRDNDQFSIGFVAQELKDVVPEAVTGEEVPFEDSDTPQERASKTMGVSKETLIPILVKAIQELTARIAILEAK